MRIPFFSLMISSPFDELKKHAEKIRECAWVFQQAMENHISGKYSTFEEYRQEIDRLENEADAIKLKIRSRTPKGIRMPVTAFQLFSYLKEQDKVLDSVKDAMNWISYGRNNGVPNALKDDFTRLVDSVIEPMEDLSRMISEAIKYFDSYSDNQRATVKAIIHNLRKSEHETDIIEDILIRAVFSMETDPIAVFHMIRLIENIGSIADHAENAGDMMDAMIARKGFRRS